MLFFVYSTLFAEPADGLTPTVTINEYNVQSSLHSFDAKQQSPLPSLSVSKSALILFAGRPSLLDLSSPFTAKGYRVGAIDTKISGDAHNILVPTVLAYVLHKMQRQEYQVVWIATPCAFFFHRFLAGSKSDYLAYSRLSARKSFSSKEVGKLYPQA